MQEFHLNLPPEIASWLLTGGSAWLEPLSPQPKGSPQEEKYPPGSTVFIAADKKWEAKVKTISTFRIKESSWQVIAQTGFPEILSEGLSLIEKKYLTESFYNQFEKSFSVKLKKNPWVYFITVEGIKITAI
jgi:hypothetical protein